MSERIGRRDMLVRTAGLGGAALGASRLTAQENPAAPATFPAAGSPQTLTLYPFEANVWVRVNDQPFTCYRTNPNLKAPYFFPLYGPGTGLPMTEEAGNPWPHHRSLFFGCDQVNRQNFWQEANNRGQIISRGPRAVPVGAKDKGRDLVKTERVIITDTCDWRVAGKPPLIEDLRHFVVWAPSPALRLIDASVTLKALVDVHVGKTNHSFFAVRAARELTPAGGGRLINSKGQQGEKATYGEPARWCGFQGTRFGITESIVLFDHPNNPWAPTCPWFTRDYGFMSPTPFNWLEKGWDLPRGQSIRLLYRVAVFTGAIWVKQVDDLWKAFAEAPEEKAG